MGDDIELGLQEVDKAEDIGPGLAQVDSKPAVSRTATAQDHDRPHHLQTLLSTHSNNLSLSDVNPVDVKVRNLA